MQKITYALLLMLSVTFLTACSKQTASAPEMWGRAEAKEVDINSKIPGRVINLLVKEGDIVEKGQLLARIDNRDIVAQANQSRANINALEAQTVQASTVTVQQDRAAKAALNTAYAQLEKAQSDLALAQNDYNRFNELLASGAVSRQVFDTYNTKYQVAQAAYSQAEAGIDSA